MASATYAWTLLMENGLVRSENTSGVRSKEQIYQQIWHLIYEFRQIPKPLEFQDFFQCSADGTASHNVLIEPLPEHDLAPLANDTDLSDRIYEHYYHFNGRRYEKKLPNMLLRTEKTVFIHGDIAPRNILIVDDITVDGEIYCPVIGIIDWKRAGWHPEYWEYANMMKPSADKDWQKWMVKPAPETWDLSGLVAARRVLFQCSCGYRTRSYLYFH